MKKIVALRVVAGALFAFAIASCSMIEVARSPEAAAAGSRALSSTAPFTIVALPDTQYYSSQSNGGSIATFKAQTQWIVDNRSALNIQYATHLGDIVDCGGWTSQLSRAQSALDTLRNSTLPYGILPGNHEGYSIIYTYSSKLSNYNKYFPLSTFSSKPWFGGSYPSGTMNNSYVLFSVDGLDFIGLSLGVQGYNGSTIDANARAWANQILDQYPNRRAIISTHDYMDDKGVDATGTTLWNTVVKTHSNVFLVLCGHNTREKLVTSTNDAGKPVYQIMTDYQDDAKGGNGWLRYYTFKPAENKIEAWTYSPTLKQFESDADSRFDLSYTMQ